ncbi:hypothetical protein PPACK8108_LOCUS18092 [Phakopsora pachyrhizi]|uniref:Uncharacterized protein n=1 Tax=Phakopsora pachyrhizi TaxID=170000 RepID=A0AAV0BDY0_PHAPC|nr:hypothetical protein PPACK8108_LOCUS18092 [Phakopsora pachyrhizi]
MSNLDRNEHGLLFTNGIGIGSLGSLIPLYSSPLCPQTPSALRERMANDYDHLQHLTNSNLSNIEKAVSLSNLSSHRHTMNAEASGIVGELRIRGIGSSTGAASQMNLDIPNQTDSVSPIDISDDERPPP